MARFAVALFSLGACIPIPTPATPQAPSQPACYDLKEEKDKVAPLFLARGNEARDRALYAENQRLMGSTTTFGDAVFAVWTSELKEARDCYDRALRVLPDSYDAEMGLGIIYFLAGVRSDANGALSLYSTARQHFGRSYFLRSDQHDALLYLAFISILERRFEQANQILDHLQRVNHRPGEVMVLRGYAAELSRNPSQARQHFQKAIEVGATSSTLSYANLKLRGPQP